VSYQAIMLDRSIVRYSNRRQSCHSNGCHLSYMGPIAPGLALVEIHQARSMLLVRLQGYISI